MGVSSMDIASARAEALWTLGPEEKGTKILKAFYHIASDGKKCAVLRLPGGRQVLSEGVGSDLIRPSSDFLGQDLRAYFRLWSVALITPFTAASGITRMTA